MTRDELEKMLSEMEADAEFFINRAEDDHVVDEKHFKIKKLITMLRESLRVIDEKDGALNNISKAYYERQPSILEVASKDDIISVLKQDTSEARRGLALKPSFLKEGT